MAGNAVMIPLPTPLALAEKMKVGSNGQPPGNLLPALASRIVPPSGRSREDLMAALASKAPGTPRAQRTPVAGGALG